MSCSFCAHWVRHHTDYTGNGVGMCSLNPQWLETTADHYCGQLVLHASNGGTMEDWRSRLTKSIEETSNERSKRLALEKQLKAMKNKLKRRTNE